MRIGIVGIGFMGMIHYLAAKRTPGVKVAAIATRDPRKRAGDWTMIQGNFGPRGQQEDLTGVTVYDDLAALLGDTSVDLVDICLPNDGHHAAALAALRSGKHVLVEKAIALTIEQADEMLAAAADAGKTLQVAHVLPFFPEFKFALEAARDRRYGALRGAHFRRHISPPDWSGAMADLQRTGGPIVDLHIHDTHFIALLAGRPQAVFSRGLLREGVPEYVSTQYLYDEPTPCLTATSGSISSPSRPFTHGFEIYFDDATVYFEAGTPLTVYTKSGVETPSLPAGDPLDAFADELKAAIEVASGRTTGGILDGKLARDALALCLRERESILSGQMVLVD